MGRPISHIRHNLVFADGAGSPSSLETLGAEVIASVREQEHEVRDRGGRWYSLRVRPYMTLDNKVDGAVLVLVLVLVDIDDLKRSEQAAAARDYAEAIVHTARDPLVILDAGLRVHTANEAFYSTFKVSPTESEGHLIYELGNRQWQIPQLRQLLEDILPRNSFFNHFEVTHDFEGIGRRTMLLNARRLEDTGGGPARILLGIQDVTEVLQFQIAARESQARYEALIDASAQIVWTTAPGGAVVEDSPLWRAFTGQTFEEWNGSGWLDALHPDDRERVGELWQRAVAEGTAVKTEYRVRHVSGDWRWTAVRAVPVWNPNGSVREWIGMNIDFTERKRAEEARGESEERYRTLFASAPMAVFVCDRNAVIQQYNHRAVELWGREPTCGVEKHCGSTRLWLPDGTLLPHDQSPMVDVLRTGVPAHNVEVFIERPDGSRLPVLVNFAVLKNAQGEVTGAITSFIDITERKQAEDKTRQAEERLRFVMDSMPQKIFTAKPNGDVDYFNPIWTEFTGLPFEQIRDWGWTQFIHPEDVDENVRVWQHSIDTGEPFQFEHRFRRADGEYRWHLSRALPMRNAEGRIVMWIGSSTEVHEQQQTANKLEQLAAELSEADRCKNEFLAMLAHELRNPLAPIRNALQIMRLEQNGEGRGPRPETPEVIFSPLTTPFEMIERQIGQMVRLVDDLLDVSRISRGKVELRAGRIELASAVNHAVEAICPQCKSMDHELTVTLPPKPRRARPGLWFCGDCRTQFTVTVGTVFEDSKVPLHKWVYANHLICSSKKGISSKQLERGLKVSYKTAWFMSHRLRAGMKTTPTGQLGGFGKVVEADETYWGNKPTRSASIKAWTTSRRFSRWSSVTAPCVPSTFLASLAQTSSPSSART